MLLSQLDAKFQQQFLITDFDQCGDRLSNTKEANLLTGQAGDRAERFCQVGFPGPAGNDLILIWVGIDNWGRSIIDNLPGAGL